MANTVFSYKIRKGDSYNTIANRLIADDGDYQHRVGDNNLVQQVITGLQYHTGNKRLIEGKSLNLIQEVDYYLVLRPVQKRSEKLNSATKEETNTLNQYNIPTDDLLFNVKIYQEYKCYSWREEPEYGFLEKYGAVGGPHSDLNGSIFGDKDAVFDLKEWYIYIFEEENIKHVYYAHSAAEYQEVEIAGEKVNYDTFIGKKRPYIWIKDYFSEENKGATEWRVYVSKIKLLDERIFGKQCSDLKLSKDAGQKISRFLKDYNDEMYRLSGPEFLRKYRNRELTSIVPKKAHIITTTFASSKNGLTLYFPDPLNELKLRGDHFNRNWETWINWQEDETHVRETFMYEVVNKIIQLDHGMVDYVDKVRLRAWKEEDIKQFKLKNYPVYFGTRYLIQWLKSTELTECLKDHLAGSDVDQQTSAEFYSKAIKNLYKVEAGAEYLEESFDDRFHYLNMSIAINEAYIKENQVLSTFVAIRKWNNFATNLFSEVIPAFVKKYGSASISKILNKINKAFKISISTIRKQPLKSSSVMVDVADVDRVVTKISSLAATSVGKSIINILEVANLAVSIKVLIESGEQNRLENSLAVAGAALDLASENWLFKNCLKHTIGEIAGTRVLPGLQLISGVIDCYLGIQGWNGARKSGEKWLSIGWGTFALGGCLVAVGAAVQMAGVRSVIISKGTASKLGVPTIIVGIALEGIGLLMADYFDNRDMKEWLEQCIFGKENKMIQKFLYENKDEDKEDKEKDKDNDKIREEAEHLIIKKYGSLDSSLKKVPGYTDYFRDAAAEESFNWNGVYREIRDFEFKSKNSNEPKRYKDTLQPQIDKLNYLMCEFKVSTEFSSPSLIFRTQVDIIIEPRMLTPYATIEISDVKAFADDGWFEFTDINTQIGTEKSSNKTIDMAKLPPGLRVEKQNGIIKKIFVPFVYRMDIDKVIGTIRIKMNDRSLQVREEKFEEESRVFD